MALALVVLAFVAAALGGAVWSLRWVEQAARQSAVESLTSRVDAAATAMSHWSASAVDELHETVRSRALDRVLADDTTRVSAVVLDPPDGVFVLDAQGEVVLDAGVEGVVPHTESDHLARARSAGEAVTLRTNVVAGTPRAELVTTLRLAHGPRVGFAQRVSPVTREQWSLVGVSPHGQTGEVYVIDSEGYAVSPTRYTTAARRAHDEATDAGWRPLRIAAPTENWPRLDAPPLTRLARALVVGEMGSDGAGYPDYRGVRVVGAWRPVPALEVGLGAEADEEEVLAGVQLARAAVWTTLCVSAGLAMLLWLVIRVLRRRADLERHRRESVFRESPIPLTLSSGPEGRMVLVSDAFGDVFGIDPEQAVGRTVAELGIWPTEADRDRYAEALAEADGCVSDYRCTLLAAGGRPLACSVSAREVVVDGEICRVATVTDLSDRERLEQQLQRAAKLEIIGRLTGGLAHDFNNILTVTALHAELLLQDRGIPVSARLHAAEIAGATDKATRITRQLLALSRREALEPSEVDVDAVVADMLPMLTRLVGEPVRIETELDAAASRVLCDPSQLEQVLLNLCVNARDAMPTGGTIRIETSTTGGASRGVALVVTDDGEGMDEETAARAFEPFFSTKEVGRGTGLGLATVASIVEQLEGSVTVESTPGVGTCFTLALPATRPSDVPTTTDVAARHERAVGARVLLVEDQGPVRVVARSVVESAGHEVVAVAGPTAALAVIDGGDTDFDLLLSDVVMPDGSGPELYDQLSRRLPGLALVLMSGFASEEVVEGYAVPAATPFVSKPFRSAELLEAIDRALARPELLV